MELKYSLIPILFCCVLLGISFYWLAGRPPQQPQQNLFAYAEEDVSFGVYWYDNATGPVTNIDWSTVGIGTKSVIIYIRNEGDVPLHTYAMQENWFPRSLYGNLNLYVTPKTQQINVDEVKSLTMSLCLNYMPEPVNFTGDTIIYGCSESVAIPDKEVFSELWDYNTNIKLAMEGDPYVVESGIFNVKTLNWVPKAAWFGWGILPSSKLSLTLQGTGSDNVKIDWQAMSSNVKVAFSNGTKLAAADFWNSTTNHVELGITINSELGLSIYPEEIPRWYSWGWLIPGLVALCAAILRRIKNPYAQLFTLTLIEDGFLRISLILIRMPLPLCLPISIILDAIVHSIKQRNFKRRLLLAIIYNLAWYGLYFVGSLWHWLFGVLIAVLFHFILDLIIIRYSAKTFLVSGRVQK